MTITSLKRGDRVRSPYSGVCGTVLTAGTAGAIVQFDHKQDNATDSVYFTDLELVDQIGEESMTLKPLCDRVTALEHNVETHEGDVAALQESIIGNNQGIRAVEMQLELNARRIEEVADKTAQRFDELRDRLSALEAKDSDPLRRVPGVYAGTGDDVTDDEDQCDCFMCGGERGDIDVSHDPPSREEIESMDRHVDEEMRRQRFERESAWLNGDDDPASRDVYASVSAIDVPLRRATYSQIVDELARRK